MQKIIAVSLMFLCSGFAYSNQVNNVAFKASTNTTTINQTDIAASEKNTVNNFYCHNILNGDTSKSTISVLVEKFKKERKNNRKNLKSASKYYNPIKLIYRLFGW
ncbi:MAG TPA: hypothetical protein VF622_10640 [Segetibacter sp.]|jgi:hypothetical protein